MPLHHQYIAELRKTEKHTHHQNRKLQFGSNLTNKLLRAECPSKPTLALRRPQAGVRPGRWSEKSWPFPHSTVTMKTSNKLYYIQRSSYRFRITKNKQVNTCFFIETDCAHLPLAGKTESTILEQHTYTSFEIEHACSISRDTISGSSC